MNSARPLSTSSYRALRSKKWELNKESQPQVFHRSDTEVPPSLRALMRKVTDLQGSRKFAYLIASKPTANPKTSNPKRLKNAKEEDAKSGAHVIKELPPIENVVVPINQSSGAQGLLQMMLAKVLRFFNPVRFGYPGKNEMTKWPLYTFRSGFGKSSNAAAMQPFKPFGASRRMLHAASTKPGQCTNISNRGFSTSTVLNAKSDCKKVGGALPCLKPSGLIPGAESTPKRGAQCEKLCMPCCPPARDPPECIASKVKRECTKIRAPRPSYAECKKNKTKLMKPCECTLERQPPCKLTSSSNGDEKSSSGKC